MAAFNRMRTYTLIVGEHCHMIMSPCGNRVSMVLAREYIADLIAQGFMTDITDIIGLTMTANARGWIKPGSNIVMDSSTA